MTAYLCQCQDSAGAPDSVPGDSTTVPAAQCGGVGVLPSNGNLLACTTNSLGQVVLTYHVPAHTIAQGRADWIAVSDTTAHPAHKALQHWVYCTVYRFTSSPIARGGSLAAKASVPVTLTAEDGLDVGIANTVYLSFKASAGGGVGKCRHHQAHFNTGTVQHQRKRIPDDHIHRTRVPAVERPGCDHRVGCRQDRIH